VVVAEAVNAAGVTARSRLQTPDGYALTARTALEIARRAVAGETPPGFQTPSMAFGPDFILGFERPARGSRPLSREIRRQRGTTS